MNVISFDVEDWYQLAARRVTGELMPTRDTIFRQINALLSILDDANCKATFFVLGMVAQRYPQLVRQLSSVGHEIASHGYSHLVLDRLSSPDFEQDVAQSKDLLQQIVGEQVIGYRAPEFSISKRTPWALPVLAKLGFEYDSSIFPIRHPRYGIPEFDPKPQFYATGAGDIAELPLSAVRIAGTSVPVAGGGYFRVLPLAGLRRAVRWLNIRGLPLITYFHPYEFDPECLDLYQVLTPKSFQQDFHCRKLNARYRLGHFEIARKVAALLKEFKFQTCKEYLHAVRLAKSRTLLRPLSIAV